MKTAFKICVRDFSSSVEKAELLRFYTSCIRSVCNYTIGTNWIETFWAGVSRYPLLCRDEVDSLNLRGGTVRAIYTRKKGRVLNKTQTSPYKRHNSSEIRRDLAKRKTGVKGYS